MKLVGKVSGIDRRVAQYSRGDEANKEKRGFAVQLRPATPVDNYFGYGSMNFFLNGRDLEDFTIDLGDTLDVYLNKAGESGTEHEADDLRRKLRESEAQGDATEKNLKTHKDRNTKIEGENFALREKLTAAAHVNAQLYAQIEALKLGRTDLGENTRMLEAK